VDIPLAQASHAIRKVMMEPAAPDTRFQRWCAAGLIGLAVLLLIVRLFEAEPLKSANDRSRWCTVWSLVERNTYIIDEIRQRPGWDTIDMVQHEGHFYSSKPPLLPRIVAEIYRTLKRITGWTLESDTALVARSILLLINVIPLAAAWWCFSSTIIRHGTSPSGNLLLIAFVCFGTLLNPFTLTFNNHSVAAWSLMLALCGVIRITVESRGTWWVWLVSGLATGFLIANELPALALLPFIALALWPVSRMRLLALYLPAVALPLAALLWTNYTATGGWKPFYAYYGTEKYVYIHEGVPSYWVDPQGVDRASDPPLTYLFHCTFGHHGLFSLTPLFLLSLVGWLLAAVQYLRRSERQVRDMAYVQLAGLATVLVVGAFYLSKTTHYNYGGVSVGLRWMLWLIPCWCLALVPVMNCGGSRWWLQMLAAPLLAGSIFAAWYPQQGPWTQPWLFQWMEARGWIDYRSPRVPFPGAQRSWIGALPSGAERDADYWVEFTAVDPEQGVLQLRLEDGGPVEGVAGDRTGVILRRLIVSERPSGRVREVQVLPELFFAAQDASGKPLGLRQSLRFPTEMPRDDQAELIRLILGLPVLPQVENYRPSRIRPVRLPIRRDAFFCRQGSLAVKGKDAQGLTWTHSREIWLCDEVPFGTVQFEDRTRDASGTEVRRRLWTLTDAGRLPAESTLTVEKARAMLQGSPGVPE
jgi:hypothetical protein